jgi:hypothetical protein
MSEHIYRNRHISEELFQLCTGDLIGEGEYREVYEWQGSDTGEVIKFEQNARCFQNIMEWETWCHVMDKPIAKWFAPCISISPCGSILIMKRTEKLAEDLYPKKIPNFFTDTKFSNYGMLDNQFVCHDYGVSLLMEKGMSKRLASVNWIA